MQQPNEMDIMGILAASKEQQGRPDDRVVAVQEGEFVIPADVVVFIGQGDREAGYAQLQAVVDNVKKQIAMQSNGRPS